MRRPAGPAAPAAGRPAAPPSCAAIRVRSVDPQRDLAGRVHAELGCQLVQPVQQGAARRPAARRPGRRPAARPRCRPCRAPRPGARSSRAPPRSRRRRSGPARTIHLKPVSVSRERHPARRAQLQPAARTTRSWRVQPGRGRCASRWSASSTPSSSPDSIRQPVPSGIATAHRSASGSLAITQVGAGPLAASARARSSAPGSSGFGNGTVGKSGSGAACSAPTHRRGEAGPDERVAQTSRRRRRACGVYDGHCRGGAASRHGRTAST